MTHTFKSVLKKHASFRPMSRRENKFSDKPWITSSILKFIKTKKIALSNIVPYGICGKRVESNAVCCTLCTKRIHGRCTKMKKVTYSSARHFICRRYADVGDGTKEPVKV